jgi:hypothetical protein
MGAVRELTTPSSRVRGGGVEEKVEVVEEEEEER